MGEFFGYLASILVFMTFYMKTMVPLRIVGILSNCAFLSYAIIENLIPVMVLHALLLPLNFLRLNQIRSRIAQIRANWTGDITLEDLLPFMTKGDCDRGQVLFRKGDESHEMYFILEGTVRIEEIGKALGPGELFGEISMFAPDRKRTGTAVCETDVTLLRMSDQKVMELYDQNPSFGFYLVRLITGRLIENRAAAPAPDAELAARIVDQGLERVLGETRQVEKPSPERIRRLRVASSPYFLGATSVAAAILIYAGWTITPYLESVLFREAAVTTWLHSATSPIKGNLAGAPLTPGQRVGADGRIVTVRNEQADHADVERTIAEVARAETKVEELSAYLDRIKGLDAEFQTRTEGYARNFKRALSIEIDGWKREITHLDRELALMRVMAERKLSLAKRGSASRTAADQAQAEREALARLRSDRRRSLSHAQQRLDAAGKGVYLTGDGRVPEWAYRSSDSLRLEIARATVALADARAVLVKARISASAARRTFEETSASEIGAPPDSLVWSVYADNGEAVEVGAKVIEYINCGVILVDVPSSDVEIPLLRVGMPADVVVEGESEARRAKVLMTRGAASVLGPNNLAAVAKGRGPSGAQVILSIDVTAKDAEDCPVGRAAAVDFPDINTFDLIRARLRL